MKENDKEFKEILIENEKTDQFESDDNPKELISPRGVSDYTYSEKDARYWLNVLYNE